jgi:hypothetical protein
VNAIDPLGLIDLRGTIGELYRNPKVRAGVSYGAAVLAEYVATNMEPGTARGLVYLASSGMSIFSSAESAKVAIGAFFVAATTAETGVGVVIGGLVGLGATGAAIYDFMLALEYWEKAMQDFGYTKTGSAGRCK